MMFNNNTMPTTEAILGSMGAVPVGQAAALLRAIFATLLVFELLSYKTVLALYKKDKKLYLQGLAMNFINYILVGSPPNVLVAMFLIQKDETHATWLAIAAQTLVIIFIHSICFYHVHKAFHTYPSLYKHHKFHHRYNTLTPPSAGAAVGVVEFLVAYMGPFVLSALLLRPYRTAYQLSVFIVAVGDILDHTPMFEEWSAKYFPSWIVNVHNHLEHHRKLNVHFAAPTFDMDWIVKQLKQN